MDVHSGTGTEILVLPEDSEDTVAGPTDRDDDSNVDMAGPTDIDDDDNDDDGDDQHPGQAQIIVESGVASASKAGVATDIPCDPPMTQEEKIRLDEGDLVENLNVSLSEGGAKEHGEGETGDKNKDETPIHAESSRVATQSGDEHPLLSTIEQDVVDPATHCTTQPSHSMVLNKPWFQHLTGI